MNKKERHARDLVALLDEFYAAGDARPLTDYLMSYSDLPGRRANLELAGAFGDLVECYAGQERLWELVTSLAAIPADEAPVNTPREFLPFCGAIGIGALGSVASTYIAEALNTLKELANDPRWRMREAVCFGLQRILARHGQDTMSALNSWIANGSPLELRAAACAAAEPMLLQDADLAHAALRLHEAIMTRLSEIPDRKSEAFKTLRQGLGYTLSVVVQALPQAGFELLAGLAVSADPDVRWVVKQNLKKNRLVKHFPAEIDATMDLLSE
jgi:hypothetical protein